MLLLAPLLVMLMFITSADQQGFLPVLLRMWMKQTHACSERLSPTSSNFKEDAESLPGNSEGGMQGHDHNNQGGFDVSLLALPLGEKGGSVAATWLAFSKVPFDELHAIP
eukprot:CAMPEP_0172678640 /NCGR_PEP_ID=MMETSP1074-20121228/15557_1 /TAXON_ID=2916 /ORGANISM="Ceratium fusus, Strain PA161109" /LENGTH=109 /DNA_ID=CAMNT_0013496723 /DNA_START=105 /DNA_END=434 /DNA_ORIENTATION=-